MYSWERVRVRANFAAERLSKKSNCPHPNLSHEYMGEGPEGAVVRVKSY